MFEKKHKKYLVGGFNLFLNISQIGSFSQEGVKIENIWNHHLPTHCFVCRICAKKSSSETYFQRVSKNQHESVLLAKQCNFPKKIIIIRFLKKNM